MRWHTVRFDARANRVEIYRHADDFCDGGPLILIDASVERFCPSPDGCRSPRDVGGSYRAGGQPGGQQGVGNRVKLRTTAAAYPAR